MTKALILFAGILLGVLSASAQVLGNGSIDSTKITEQPADHPKGELKSFDLSPTKSQDNKTPPEKKVEVPVLSPSGKPKKEY